MQNDRTTKMLNDQIQRELRNLNSFVTDEDEKPAIIQRIAALTAMLNDSPEQKECQPATAKDLVSELIAALRRH